MNERYLGEKNPKLGFGFMRIPVVPRKGSNWAQGTMEFDYEKVCKMVDDFMAAGGNTFHTAYAYEGSEAFLGKTLVQRYPRESFQIVDNLPVHIIEDGSLVEGIFNEMLEHLGVDYVDYLMLHMLRKPLSERCEKNGIWDFVKKMKDEGKAKHIGFSFHDGPQQLDEILTAHPEVDCVQLQINYLDWDTTSPNSKGCYEVAWKKHQKPFFVMEPVKGGNLSADIPAITDVFKPIHPNRSNASWAIRWVLGLDGLISAFSGMSSPEQAEDNIKTWKNYEPLNEEEKKAVAKVVYNLNNIDCYMCTHCRYCIPLCPMNISCCDMIDCVNMADTYHQLGAGKHHYDFMTGPEKQKAKPSECVACGACEGHCPQHLPIIKIMERCAEIYDDPNLVTDQA